MNRLQLIAGALGDSHREDYATKSEDGIPITTRFVAEAEAMISARLEAYGLQKVLTDADRPGGITSPIYTLPSKIRLVRHLFLDGCAKPLDAVDETVVAQRSQSTRVEVYAVRVSSVILAGTPAENSTLTLHYFGLPDPLVQETDTNQLLNDYPQLYKEAMQVSIFKRARDYEAASAAFSSANGLIDEINRQVKKLLGGARSSNPYNVTWRSSY